MKLITLKENIVSAIMIFMACSFSFGQRQPVEQYSFSSNAKTPIKIDAERSAEQIIFFGSNNSYIPYQIELEFSQLNNLHPATTNYKIVMQPGRTRLFELAIIQKNNAPTYSFSFRYHKGDATRTPDFNFPYLIPFTVNKKISTTQQFFKVSKGDTICAVRKGRVTALPESYSEIDRLFQNSIEIYQLDGTLAVYFGPQMKSFLKEGDVVFPGQPIGIIAEEIPIQVSVFHLAGNNIIKSFPISYTTDGSSLIALRELDHAVSTHPKEIIQKELTKSELKKWQKGSLY